ncbi:erythromycin esterase family protein [Streptomyces sp. NPDC039016]|uniref:erythromycin esterase family protein n=1 Tax=Streptomyces sp. NPDC039016 TaxID=3154330 RepID=UPI0033DB4AFB
MTPWAWTTSPSAPLSTGDPSSPRTRRSAATGRRSTSPPAGPGTNEYTLDQVRYRDYYTDLRKVPATARNWLDISRPTYDVGTQFPNSTTPELAIGRAYDVLFHLHTVREASKL